MGKAADQRPTFWVERVNPWFALESKAQSPQPSRQVQMVDVMKQVSKPMVKQVTKQAKGRRGEAQGVPQEF